MVGKETLYHQVGSCHSSATSCSTHTPSAPFILVTSGPVSGPSHSLSPPLPGLSTASHPGLADSRTSVHKPVFRKVFSDVPPSLGWIRSNCDCLHLCVSPFPVRRSMWAEPTSGLVPTSPVPRTEPDTPYLGYGITRGRRGCLENSQGAVAMGQGGAHRGLKAQEGFYQTHKVDSKQSLSSWISLAICLPIPAPPCSGCAFWASYLPSLRLSLLLGKMQALSETSPSCQRRGLQSPRGRRAHSGRWINGWGNCCGRGERVKTGAF